MPRQTLYRKPHPQIEPWPPETPEQSYGTERSIDVFRASCAAIGNALQPLGFKYLRSKQTCSRTREGFEQVVHFRTSSHNLSGYHVQLWMYATVYSQRLKTWREVRLPTHRCTSHVAGGMVHLLDTKYSLVQWELANPAEREATIADAVEFIESNVLPFFSRFDDPDTLIASLEKQEVPAMNLLTAVEFAYCFAGKGKAQAVLNGFVNANPNLASAIAEAQVAALTSKLTEPGDYAQQVVYLRVLHGLA